MPTLSGREFELAPIYHLFGRAPGMNVAVHAALGAYFVESMYSSSAGLASSGAGPRLLGEGRARERVEDVGGGREESADRGGLRQEVEEEMGPANVSGSRGRSLPLSPVRIKRAIAWQPLPASRRPGSHYQVRGTRRRFWRDRKSDSCTEGRSTIAKGAATTHAGLTCRIYHVDPVSAQEPPYHDRRHEGGAH
ncbi:uncharacterized protein SCHCODRAFT_02506449 [Schizophyllum commune H4-8]|uniref:uncharacterized protein n=1 Tax=Schizophyllum commune (strain H4-8 / FGSC 9210) TaxID=578458 RepID=UPI002160D85C|nr:uncharacterized protein SCHCODRAFT_02506449 [Schizophyllum commune H4-8]KAI5891452.1 hypothetical protein SCHCODRAFT_02506449 [Schizophyllum commune H4-8]